MWVAFMRLIPTCPGAAFGTIQNQSQSSLTLTTGISLLPSSVKVILPVAGPYPAEVLALTETLYGMYLSV